MAGNFKKTVNETAVVLPYSIWSGLKNCPRDIIIDTIDLMIAYDYRWLGNEEAGLPQTIPKPAAGRKLNPTAITLFTFARGLIDANNRRYYGKQLEKIEKDRKAAETGATSPESAIDDHLPDGL